MAEVEMGYGSWRNWFGDALRLAMVASGPVFPAIFYVTDRRYDSRLVSKAAMVFEAAEGMRRGILWHKIALRRDVGKVDLFRPTFSHVIAVGGASCRPGPQSPDVFQRGKTLYANGMGCEAARFAVRHVASAGIVYNPFCGRGTVLAAADEVNIDSLGVDNDEAQVRFAEVANLPA
jgi:hypothetical protein